MQRNKQLDIILTMNNVRIKIHELGMIRESEEIALNKLMLFSGESGLGKSYLSIICHYVFAVLLDETRIASYFERKGFDFNELRKNYHNSGIAIAFQKSEFEEWLSKDAIVWLGYMIGNKNVKGDIRIILPDIIPNQIEITYNEEMTGLGNEVETYLKLELPGLSYRVKDSGGINDESPFAFLFRYYLINTLFDDFRNLRNSFVFPPSRGPILTEIVDPTTGMYVEFKKSLQYLATAKPNAVNVSDRMSSLLQKVLNGHVSRKEGQYYYTTDSSSIEMPLSASAASIRELAPFEFLVENSDISKAAIMIDEPEAHLHPLKQRMMADIIACLLSGGAHLQITTHSDYFIRRLNELIMQYQIQKRQSFQSIQRYFDICTKFNLDPELNIDENSVSAYFVKRKDASTSIVIKQDMTKGVPFSSFHEAINDSLFLRDELEKLLDNADY